MMPSAMSPPRLRIVDTPLGPMRLHAEGGTLTGAWFLDQDDCPASPPLPADDMSSRAPIPDTPISRTRIARGATGGTCIPDAVLDQAVLELAEYFAGQRREFSLPMATHGTPFQRRVWDALRDIPFGGLESYLALSERCAQAAAVRAVAQAVGRNPISIFIPCHRVIGSNSALTGFGGGLQRKQALLALEGHIYASASPTAKLAEKDPRQGDLW